MTPRLAIASALCLFSTSAFAQLVTQTPHPTGRNLGGVAFTSPTHGFVVGENHHLIETFDGGHTWTTRMATALGTDPFYTITFPDAFHGYLSGNNQDAYRTVDAGATWTQMTGFHFGSASHLDFISPTEGFAGYNGALTFTPDGGTTWQIASGYPDCPIMFGLDFRDTQVGLACGIRSSPHNDSGIYRSFDQGHTWTLVYEGSVNDVLWLNNDTVLAIDSTSVIRSDDQGLTWVSPAFNTVPTGLGALTRAGDSSTIAGVSLSGDIWTSPDMGYSWFKRVEGIGVLPATWSISFFDNAHGWVVGANGLTYATSDGGDTWELLNSGCGDEVMAIDFAQDERLGVAVTHRGFLFRTRDRGGFWDVRRLKVTGIVFGREEGLRAVDVIDDTTIVTGGMGGIFFRSEDAGDTWTSLGFPQSLPPTFEIKTIHFADRYNGLIAGFGGEFAAYYTTDGGYWWTPIPEIEGSIAAGDSKGSNRWLLTAGNRVYRSTDDGVTWSYQGLPGDASSLTDIEFANPEIGWTVGFFGYMARSTNAGATWTQVVQPVNETYLDVEVLSPSEIMVLGYDSNTYRYFHKRSTNSGTTWTRTNLNQYEEGFGELWASPSGRFWIAGSFGKILYQQAPALSITLPVGVPMQIAPGVSTTMPVRVVPGDDQIAQGSPTLWLQRTPAAPFEPLPLSNVVGDDYLATFPPLLCSDTPRFYLSAQPVEGAMVRLPASAPASAFSTRVGVSEIGTLLATDFTAGLPAGWSATGLWHITTACAPAGTCDSGNTAYFGQDATCNFNLPTRASGVLRSPSLTLPVLQTGENILLKFCSALDTEYPNGAYGDADQAQVWFVHSTGASPLVWFTDHSTALLQTLDLSPHAGRTGRLEWRFDSIDTYMNSFRGWHVDNIVVTGPALACTDPPNPCPADFNHDGALDFFDYDDFVRCFEGSACPPGSSADFDADSAVDFFDYDVFVVAFEAGC